MPKVAIITAMYNAESTIGGTIDSVLNQSFGDWEWFIMDDGSSDGSAAIVKDCAASDRRVHYVACGRVAHIGKLRNRGSRRTEASFLNFLDADDRFHPTFLDRQIGVLEATGAAMAHTHANFFSEEGVRSIPLRYRGPKICPPPQMFSYLKKGNSIISPSVVIRASVFRALGGFSENHYHFSNLDGNLWLRMAPDQVFAFQPEPLIDYFVAPNSLSHAPANAKRNCQGNLLSLQEAVKTNVNLKSPYRRDLRYRLGKEHALFAKILLSEPDPNLDLVQQHIRQSVHHGFWWSPFLVYQILSLTGGRGPLGYHRAKNAIKVRLSGNR